MSIIIIIIITIVLLSFLKTVENFLDHSVRYFVTNKSKADIEKATMAKTPSGQSPQTPSTG